MAAVRIAHLPRILFKQTKVISRMTYSSIDHIKCQKVLETRKKMNVLDSYMSYLDTGIGDDSVLFIHGNPTSSYLWRNIIPHVQPIARCIAPDLIGMGQSGKEPNNSYRFVDHFKYLSEWIDSMNVSKKIHFVVHDWGSGLGFHWCNLHRDRVASITYIEAVVGPVDNLEIFPEEVRSIFKDLRSPKGEEMVLKNNIFLTTLLPYATLRKLNQEEMDYYLSPYKEQEESRLPTLTWAREIPVISEGPSDVVKFTTDYSEWLAESKNVPKLYIHVEPGLLSGTTQNIVKNWPNNRMVTVKGHHFAQEDSPNEIGQAIRNFIMSI